TLNDEDVDFGGTMHFDAVLGIADALDFNHAVAQDAAAQKALGSAESLDVRRSKALGNLARAQTALDLAGAGADPTKLPPAREVVVHTHFDATTDGETTVFGPTGRMEEGQRLVLLEQVQGWCTDSHTKVTIKPVIDLNTELTAPGYEIPTWLREQVALRDGRRNLGSHATPWLSAVLVSIFSSISAGVRKPWRLRGLELSSAA
ncbi:hypothetical protein NOCD_21850, partial [Nocardioides cavernae]|nr:hypothetical protein [Nocardioides cavernae]